MGGRGRGRRVVLGGRGGIQGVVLGGEVAGVAPGEGLEAKVEDAVEFVKGDAHVEAGFGGGEAIAACLLHDGEGVKIKPAEGGIFEF